MLAKCRGMVPTGSGILLAGPRRAHGTAYPFLATCPSMRPASAAFLDRLRLAMALGDGPAGSAAAPTGSVAVPPTPELQRISALVELAQRGDSDAFGQLYERYVDTVYRYIYVRVGQVPSPRT
jgi:hypothetical protein